MADNMSIPDQGAKPSNAPMLIVGGLLLAGFLLLTLFAQGSSDRRLNSSPIGVKMLGPWLQQSDIQARSSHPRLHPSTEDLSIRILPLYDLNMQDISAAPVTLEDRLNSGNQRDILQGAYWAKITDIQTIVLLPKWRGALAETAIAHDQALIPLDDFDELLPQIGLRGVRLQRSGAEFITTAQPDGSELALFHAQTFDPTTIPKTCSTEVHFGYGALVILCDRKKKEDYPVYFVADPDLMNNHGLAVADNAAFVATFLQHLLKEDKRPVYIDRSPDLLTTTDWDTERQDYDRGFAEFARLFDYPFSMLWAILLITLAALYWRGAKRFGPLAIDNPQAREHSKRAAISAQARLLRLSGNDGRMVADFVRSKLQGLSHHSFGRDLGQDAEARFLTLLGRRDPALAEAFSAVTKSLIHNGPDMPAHQLHAQLASFHVLLQKVMEHHGPI